MDDKEEPSGWNVYFEVADVDAALARVEELGGKIISPAEDTPYGRLARAADPTGTAFRLVANNSRPAHRSVPGDAGRRTCA